MFRIKAKDLDLRLEVLPVNSLRLHEKTIPGLEKALVLEFKNCAYLHNPIIVDENHIVLDGNHRAAAFAALGFRYMIVCKIDYLHATANLRYWFRLVENIESMQVLEKITDDLGGKFLPVTDKEALQETLAANLLNCGIQTNNFYAVISFPETLVFDSVSAYDVLENIQNRLIESNIKLEYIPCQYVNEDKFCSELGADRMVIWTPQISKEMVVAAAGQAKLFAPKTTRHLIPARPLNVNVPTYWLNENIALDDINHRVTKYLERKSLKRFGPGQVIEGRYYEEELFVFFDKKDSGAPLGYGRNDTY